MLQTSDSLENLEDIYNRLDEFCWLLKCFMTCHFDEFHADQYSAAISCLSKALSSIKLDLLQVIEKYYKE